MNNKPTNTIFIILLIMAIIGLVLIGFHGYVTEENRKEDLRRINVIEEKIHKTDSLNTCIVKRDSLRAMQVDSLKARLKTTKIKYGKDVQNYNRTRSYIDSMPDL